MTPGSATVPRSTATGSRSSRHRPPTSCSVIAATLAVLNQVGCALLTTCYDASQVCGIACVLMLPVIREDSSAVDLPVSGRQRIDAAGAAESWRGCTVGALAVQVIVTSCRSQRTRPTDRSVRGRITLRRALKRDTPRGQRAAT